MKRFIFILTIVELFMVSLGNGPTYAGEVDILINKLVEKGILSRSEASALIQDMQKEGARQKEELKAVATEAAKEEAKASAVQLPKWVEKMKF